MVILVVGGTSGLGLELAKALISTSSQIIITGRKDPGVENLQFKKLDLTKTDMPLRVKELIDDLPEISMLVYAAGYYQEGRITDLTDNQIEEMISVGGRGLIYSVKAVLKKQDKLDTLVTITSTSQWTPRQLEPIYNFAKAGAGHFSNAIAEDGRVKKVLVVGPAGMRTKFWDGVPRDDLNSMMDPSWVAGEIHILLNGNYRFKFAKILREPARVEVGEVR